MKYIHRLMFSMLIIGCLSSPLLGADDSADTGTKIDNLFCQKCHLKEIEAIETEGLAHKTEISCIDCHRGHKPKSLENIPNCSQCHEGTPHFDQLQCLNCHRDPHRPLQIKLPKKAHAECLTCHDTQGEELVQHQSYHSQLVCTDCHYEHGFLPECMSCHKSHAAVMAEEQCQDCHAPHKPLEMVFATAEIPSAFCAPCHLEASTVLAKTQKKHGQLSCVECHMEQHATITECQECHGEPHASAMHTKFPLCGDCHGTAHNLE